jgi:hypothetical protein
MAIRPHTPRLDPHPIAMALVNDLVVKIDEGGQASVFLHGR